MSDTENEVFVVKVDEAIAAVKADEANNVTLKADEKRPEHGKSQISKLFHEDLGWGFSNVASMIKARSSSSFFDDDDEDGDDDKVKEAVHGVYSWIRSHALSITTMILSLAATTFVFIFDPNNEIRTSEAIGLWIWTALPGMVILVYLGSAIIERIARSILARLSARQPTWLLVVIQAELETYMRLILFTFALDEFILDWFNLYSGSPVAVQRFETLIRSGLRSVYTVALLLLIRNISLNLLEYTVTKRSFRKEIFSMNLMIDTLQRLFCRSPSEHEELERIWSQNKDRSQFMYRVSSIRDLPIRLHLGQRPEENDTRLGFSKIDIVEVHTVKDINQLVGVLFDDIAQSVDNQPAITLPEWRQYFKDIRQSRRAFQTLYAANPAVLASRTVHKDDFISAWQRVFKSRSALSNQLLAAKNVYKLVQSVAGVAFWIIMMFVIARNFGFDVGQVVTAASAFVISFAFATSKSLSRVVESIMFVFVTHPYQVNDSVKIGGKWFVVESIGILETRVRDGTNMVTRYSNAVLADMEISNVVFAHHHHIVCIVNVLVAIDTRLEQLEQLRTALVRYTAEHPQAWKPGRVVVSPGGLTPSNKIELEIKLESSIDWSDQQTYKLWDFTMKCFLFATLTSLNLNWNLPTQPIVLLDAPKLKAESAVAS